MKQLRLILLCSSILIVSQSTSYSAQRLLSLPFQNGTIKQCVQGANGSYSHNFTSTQYDIDFDTDNLSDEILTAPADGIAYTLDDGLETGFGKHVIIDLGDGTFIILGHCKSFIVSNGENVTRGQPVAIEGTTGNSQGDHVHFGLHAGDPTISALNSVSIEADFIWGRDITIDGTFQEFTSSSFIGDLVSGHFYETDNSSIYLQIAKFIDGWHKDTSQAFWDKYISIRNEGHPLGDPWDNGPGGVYVHELNGMLIQDFQGADNNFDHPYTAFIKGPNSTDLVCLLKEGFWSHYMNEAGWLSYGYPVSDEYPWIDDLGFPWQRQDFIDSDGTERYLLWNGYTGVVPMGTLGDEVLHLFNLVFDHFPGSSYESSFMSKNSSAQSDGVYHSGQFVADFGVPIHLLENQTYSGLYAMVGGMQIDIDQFTVNGDMTIFIGDEPVPNPCELGNLNLTEQVYDVVVQSNYAYLANFQDGLISVDISDPTSPYVVGSVDTYKARNLEISGDYVYLADDAAGLKVINISDPSSLNIVGSVDPGGLILGLDLSGQYIYAACRSSMQIIDISNPSSPTIVGWVNLPDNVIDVSVYGNYAYVAGWISGIHVIDISDPTSPVLTNTINTFPYVFSVDTQNDYLYMGGNGDFAIFDISNPSTPTLVSNIAVGSCYGTKVYNEYVYLSVWSSGIQIIDISDSNNPTIVSFPNTPGYARHTTIVGNYLYVADQVAGLTIFQKNCGTIPDVVSDFTADITDGYASLTVQFVDQSTGYPTSWMWNFGDGITSTLQQPSHTYIASGNYMVNLIVDNGITFDTTTKINYITVNDSPVPNPCEVGHSYFPSVGNIKLSDNYAYMLRNQATQDLVVMDITDPTNPIEVGYTELPHSSVIDLNVEGNYAYIIAQKGSIPYNDGLYRVDISNPTNPVLVDVVPMPNDVYPRKLTIDSGYVYIVTYDRLLIYNISSIHTLLGNIPITSNSTSIGISGEYIYIGNYTNGLQVINISDRSNPFIVNSISTLSGVNDVSISGNNIYLASDPIEILNISDPINPVSTGNIATPGISFAIEVNGNYAYVADFTEGFSIVDISDTYSLQLINTLEVWPLVNNLDILNGYIYLAAGLDGGLTIFEKYCTPPSCCHNIRGNVNGDPLDQINISDLVALVAYMFQGGTTPPCLEEADIDGSETINISDLVSLIAYMFQGGTAPANCP